MKWISENGTSASAISRGDITALNHELQTSSVDALNRDTEKGTYVWNDSMDGRTTVSESVLSCR